MKRIFPAGDRETLQIDRLNFRSLAAHHAIGISDPAAPEKQRLLDLAVTEAEALACETGVPELVLLTLAEEKVQFTRTWIARQAQLKEHLLHARQ